MTNAEKYLKDEVSAREFREKLVEFIFDELGFYDGTSEAIDKVIGDFLDMIEKPTLTEDERVILRKIREKENKYITRDKAGYLYITEKPFSLLALPLSIYNHLFQFIQPRRRI